jgi:cytidylate kinase
VQVLGTLLVDDQLHQTGVAARAQRRAAEEGGSDVRATESSLLARDRIDSTRTASPLTMAEDAVHIDSTPYTLDEVVDLIVELVEKAR